MTFIETSSPSLSCQLPTSVTPPPPLPHSRHMCTVLPPLSLEVLRTLVSSPLCDFYLVAPLSRVCLLRRVLLISLKELWHLCAGACSKERALTSLTPRISPARDRSLSACSYPIARASHRARASAALPPSSSLPPPPSSSLSIIIIFILML